MPSRRSQRTRRARVTTRTRVHLHRSSQREETQQDLDVFQYTFLHQDPRLLPSIERPAWSIVDDLQAALDAEPEPRERLRPPDTYPVLSQEETLPPYTYSPAPVLSTTAISTPVENNWDIATNIDSPSSPGKPPLLTFS